jgi:predicted nucleotidyltransferase
MGRALLRRYRREILNSAARHGLRNVRVFGSVARGDDPVPIKQNRLT